jgi:type IV pilus assembly protein PilB
MAQSRRRIGEILIEWGALTQQGVDEALEHAMADGTRIGEALIALGLCDEEDITKALATQFNMEYIDLDQNIVIPAEVALSEEDIKKLQVLPLQLEGNRLKIVITDPLDLEVLDMLRFRLGYELDPCLASSSKLRDYINRMGGSSLSIDKAYEGFETEGVTGLPTIGEEEPSEDSSLIIRLVMMVLQEAVNGRASDIHVEPMSNRVRVRYRIDGVCIERDNIRKSLQGAVINRLKLMADLDLAERRLPQDGRIKLKIAGENIDFRVSVLPSHHGQGVVLRILRPESVRVGVESLGFETDDMSRFNRIIRRPNGIFLVTGPTGSGKTTTLYSAINELNRPDRKIITAEDPVEYNFPGVNQVQVNDLIGLTFPSILRSMLRQAPNIILVGEIRDLDVAEIAIQAALTGHLVFSTLHTNDAPSAITRLMDIGVKPFLVASSIQAIMAQRLIRVICKECKEVDPEPDPQQLRLLGFHRDEIAGATFYHGRGCSACGGTGYRGRQGIFELMEMDAHVRELAFRQAPLAEIRRAAIASSMRPLLEDGKLKVLAGITTPEELVRIAQSEELSFDDA